MKIIKVSGYQTNVWDLSRALVAKGIQVGDRFGISWKIGKKRKLKAYRLTEHTRIVNRGDDSGLGTDWIDIRLNKGGSYKIISDDVMRIPYLDMYDFR